MQTRIQKWGNSLGLRVPRSLAEQVGLREGSAVNLSIEDDHLVVRPEHRRKYKLEELVQAITAKNRHAEVDSGGAVGRETW